MSTQRPNLFTIVLLVGFIVMMWFADDIGEPTIGLFCLIAAMMVAGWYLVRNRIDSDLLESGILSGEAQPDDGQV